MRCSIYKGPNKPGLYLYVPTTDDFSEVPEGLLAMLGEPQHVMDLDLSPQRTLAKEDPLQVIHNLRTQGYHVQLPDQEDTVANFQLDFGATYRHGHSES